MVEATHWPIFMALAFIRHDDVDFHAWLDRLDFSALNGAADQLSTAGLEAQFERETKLKLPPTKGEVEIAIREAVNATVLAVRDRRSMPDDDLAAMSKLAALRARRKALHARRALKCGSLASLDHAGAWRKLRNALLKGEVASREQMSADRLPREAVELPDDFELMIEVASLKLKFRPTIAALGVSLSHAEFATEPTSQTAEATASDASMQPMPVHAGQKVRGRRPGGGPLENADRLLIKEMEELRKSLNDRPASRYAAAMSLSHKASGSKAGDSKARRLTRKHVKQFPGDW